MAVVVDFSAGRGLILIFLGPAVVDEVGAASATSDLVAWVDAAAPAVAGGSGDRESERGVGDRPRR